MIALCTVAVACGDGGSTVGGSTNSGGSTTEDTGPTGAATTAGSTAGDSSGVADTTGTTGGNVPPEGVLFSDEVLNIAHRGGMGTRPEHTLLAYDNARLLGADVLELDIHSTADGTLVVMHDDTVDRTTDGTGAIQSMTLDEIKALDAGYTFTEDGSTFPYRGMGLQVPTLEEVFVAHPDMPYVIEVKQDSPSIVESFVALCVDHEIHDQMVAGAFSQATLDGVRAFAPSLPTSFALPEVLEFIALTDETAKTYQPPASFLQVPPEQAGIEVITLAFIDRAAELDLKVHAWTINDEAEMQSLIDLGVDGIITDYPERLQGVLDGA